MRGSVGSVTVDNHDLEAECFVSVALLKKRAVVVRTLCHNPATD